MTNDLQHLINAISGTPPPSRAWPDILALAKTHRLGPLLYRETHSFLPSPHREQLQHDVHVNVAKTTMLVLELGSIYQLLATAGIRVFPYKGPALAQLAHGDTAMREYDDLDLIIPQEQILKAREHLLAAGYDDFPNRTDRQQRKLLRSGGEWIFRHPQKQLNLDIKPLPVSYLMSSVEEIEGLARRAVSMNIGGIDLQTLSPEDTLLTTCLHASLTRWCPMRQLADIAALLERSDINWSKLLSISALNGTQRILLHATGLASQVLGAPIPRELEHALAADKTARRLTAEVEHDIHCGHVPCRGISRGYYKLRSLQGLRRKLIFIRLQSGELIWRRILRLLSQGGRTTH